MKSNWKDEKHIVLDACALIAFLNDEPGAEIVAAILEHTPSVDISAINLLEIAYDAARSWNILFQSVAGTFCPHFDYAAQ